MGQTCSASAVTLQGRAQTRSDAAPEWHLACSTPSQAPPAQTPGPCHTHPGDGQAVKVGMRLDVPPHHLIDLHAGDNGRLLSAGRCN